MDIIKNIFEVIVVLTTVFSLIVIWLTLKEMRVQRHKLYEPYILPLNFEILYLSKHPEITYPVNTYSKFEDIKIEKKTYFPFITLRNIGQGVAKDICVDVQWEIKYHKYFKTLKSEFDNLQLGLNLRVSEESCWLELNKDLKVLEGGNYPYQNNFIKDFDYLLPIKENEEEIKIEFPSSVNLLLKLSILLLELLPDSDKQGAYDRLKKCFLLLIKVDYKDSLNKPFSFEYILNIKNLKAQMQSDINGKIYTLGIERLR